MEYKLSSILRSGRGKAYFLNVKHALFNALDIRARHPDSVIRTIMLSGVMNSYVEGSASSLGICGQTVRNGLKGQDPDSVLLANESIIKRMKEAGALKRKLTVAIDWHDVMYYGDPSADGVVGTQPKKGTHWAYQYGSMSVVLEGERLTVAMTPIVKGGQSRALHVRRLLGKASELGIKVKLVLLDAGYFSADVINYLKSSGLKFIMRMPNIGIARAGDDFIYTTTGHRRPNNWQATFRVVAMNGRDRVGHRELFIFATNTDLKARRIRKLFRKRWAIETSYRMINQFLPKTTSKAYSVRRLYFYLAVLMYNTWVMVNYGRERVIVERVRLMIVIAVIFRGIYAMDDAG